MTELMRRRRALMGAGGSADPNILFEWKPSDGLSNIEIGASSGSPSYDLMDDCIRWHVLTQWIGQYIQPKTPVVWDGDFEVEVEIKAPYLSLNVYVYTRLISNLNGRIILNVGNKTISISGGSTISVGTISAGKLSISLNRTTNQLVGKYIRESTTTQVEGTLPSEPSGNRYLLYMEGGNNNAYVDITHIVARKVVQP
jgi:hypothetical protein